MDPAGSGREGASEKTVSTRVMEIIVAAILMVLAAIVMVDSRRIGAGWAFDGPQAGYFPFYFALIIFLASAVTFVTNLVAGGRDLSNFVDRSQLTLVLKVLVPTIVYVVLIGYLGIYVASAIFIAFFMYWLGKYPIHRIAPIAVLVPLMLFMMFEVWFLVPLPKGPLEAALGY
jgi:putative tricarboxylic transport membrane protein